PCHSSCLGRMKSVSQCSQPHSSPSCQYVSDPKSTLISQFGHSTYHRCADHAYAAFFFGVSDIDLPVFLSAVDPKECLTQGGGALVGHLDAFNVPIHDDL